MIKSMTGYGRGEHKGVERSFSVELRAVNHRYLETSVKLPRRFAFAEELTPAMLVSADLFNVSEIKRVKGGGVEIKFFDRQRALERLAELNDREQSDRRARDLVEAVYGSRSCDGASTEGVCDDSDIPEE